MRKCSILLLFFLSVSVVSGQKNMFVFRNNAMINTFLIQQIDSMKFSSNLTVMDIYKHDQSVTKIPVSSIDSLQFSDNNLPEAELVKTLHNYTTSRTMCTVDIKNNGGCTLTERGVCWSTQKNPTIRDRKSSGGISTGQFYVQTGVLSVDSTYYIRAFARNCIGTAYSNEMVVKPTTGNITYTLDINPVTYPNEYKLIKEAMDSATAIPLSKGIFTYITMPEFLQRKLLIMVPSVSDQAPVICGWVLLCTKLHIFLVQVLQIPGKPI